MHKNLEEINKFESMSEFRRFEQWIDKELMLDSAIEVPVLDFFAGKNFKERWFKFESIGEIWRLVYPDGPFNGYWGRVE